MSEWQYWSCCGNWYCEFENSRWVGFYTLSNEGNKFVEKECSLQNAVSSLELVDLR